MAANLRGFFDESAMGAQDGPCMIMAGFVGTVGAFEDAAESWQSCLDKSPSIPYFHTRENMGTDRSISLANAIGQHKLFGFVITIPHAPFLNRNPKLTKGMLGTRIYDWAFIHTVLGVLSWVDAFCPPEETIDFVFDRRKELETCRKDYYDKHCAEGEGIWKRAGTCTPATDKKVAALQMGDLIAAEVLASMKLGKHTEALNEIAERRPLYLLRREPDPVIEKSMALHALGKIIFDSAREKILAQPWDEVDPAVYDFEYRTLQVISAIAKRDNLILKMKMGEYDENSSEQSGVQPLHGSDASNSESVQDGNDATNRSGEAG